MDCTRSSRDDGNPSFLSLGKMIGQRCRQRIGILRHSRNMDDFNLLLDAIDKHHCIVIGFPGYLQGVETGKFQIRSEIAADIGVYDRSSER